MNRQEIKKLIEKLKRPDYTYYGCEVSESEADLVITALSDKLNNGWISVSERLPEKDGKYTVTINWNSKFNSVENVIYTDTFNKWLWLDYDEIAEKVIAWMPMPEPYRGD